MELIRIPMERIAPFLPCVSPIYVYFPKNEKFIAVKSPLDFFDPKELEKLKPLQAFYVPPFFDSIQPIQSIARNLKGLLNAFEAQESKNGGPDFSDVQFPMSSFEKTDNVLQAIAPLWGPELKIEPFFAGVFASELCGKLPEALLKSAREKSIEVYDLAILRSSVAVFLALHLGYCDPEHLTKIRELIFARTAEVAEPNPDQIDSVVVSAEFLDLINVVERLIQSPADEVITAESLKTISSRAAYKIVSRIERVQRDFQRDKWAVYSVSGKGGFCDGST